MGVVLIALWPTLMRGVIELKPVLGANGQPMMDAGRPMFQQDWPRQVLVNWDAWTCLLGGIVCVAFGVAQTWRNKGRTTEPTPPGDVATRAAPEK